MALIKKGLLYVLVCLTLLTFITLIPKKSQRKEGLLFPSYTENDLDKVSLPQANLIKKGDLWEIQDYQGNLWPADPLLIEDLLDFPGTLMDRPINSAGIWPDFWKEGQSIQWGESWTLSFHYDEDRGWLIKYEEEIFLPQSIPPALEWTQYLDLYPLRDLDPQEAVYLQLDHNLRGAGGASFRYEIFREEGHWLFFPHQQELSEELLREYWTDISSLRAETLLSRQQVELERVRFRLTLADQNNQQWILEVGDAIQREGQRTLWPVQLQNSSYIYLFDQQELKKIARPREYFTESF